MMKYFLISEDFHAQGIMAGRQLVAIFGFLLLVLTSPPKVDAGVNTYIEVQYKYKYKYKQKYKQKHVKV